MADQALPRTSQCSAHSGVAAHNRSGSHLGKSKNYNGRMFNITWEFKLEPTPEQVVEIEHTLEVCRKVWNYGLRERKDWLESRKCPVHAC